jgi:hypothetical protein
MFEDRKLYAANSPEFLALVPYSTAAHWRNEGRGPRYIKIGPRVFYQGNALNEWLRANTVDPAAQAT